MKQKRPYLSLIDASNAIVFIITNKLYDNQIYNIVSQNFTVEGILSILKLYDKKVKFKLVNNKIMNQLSFEVSPKNLLTKVLHLRKYEKEIFKTLKFAKIFMKNILITGGAGFIGSNFLKIFVSKENLTKLLY